MGTVRSITSVARWAVGTRLATTSSTQPGVGQGPRQVARLGCEVVSTTWPAPHVPRTGTPACLVTALSKTAQRAGFQAATHLGAGPPARWVRPGIIPVMSDAATDPEPKAAAIVKLTAAAHDYEAKREAVRPALELRNERIVEAIEAGCSYREVAKAGLCSEGTVHAVLASN